MNRHFAEDLSTSADAPTQPFGRADALRTGLESCGLALDDTLAVLDAMVREQPFEDIEREIADGRLLTKRTVHGRRHILAAIRRRYVSPTLPLQPVRDLVSVLQRSTSRACRGQLLLPYILSTDRAAFEIVDSLVIPRRAGADRRLSKVEVVEGLSDVFRRYERTPWSEPVCVRWAEGLLSVLREVGALGRGQDRERLTGDPIRPHAFSFHLWGLYQSGVRGRELYESRFWRMALLDRMETRAALAAVVDRGWWRVFTVGSADEVRPKHASLGEWIDHELG